MIACCLEICALERIRLRSACRPMVKGSGSMATVRDLSPSWTTRRALRAEVSMKSWGRQRRSSGKEEVIQENGGSLTSLSFRADLGNVGTMRRAVDEGVAGCDSIRVS